MRDTRPTATSHEVAEFLRVSPRTLDAWAHEGTGPIWSKVGRHRRYRWSDVETWFDGQRGGLAA